MLAQGRQEGMQDRVAHRKGQDFTGDLGFKLESEGCGGNRVAGRVRWR